MPFTGNEDHSFPLTTACQWTKNYRDANAPAAAQGTTAESGGTTTNPLVLAHFFGRDAILDILDQADCVGIRIYYALDAAGVKQLIIVGANADEDDLYNGRVKERSIQCPPNCGIASPLAGDI